MEQKLVITPKTKILDLINDYPDLEEVLFDVSPAFRQLKNPLLRKTVARVTTLQQAAMVGGIRVEDLVNRLRKASGTSGYLHEFAETDNYPPASDNFPSAQPGTPGWFSPEKISMHLDAREMLNRGEHPAGQVLADLKMLPDGEIYELVAPFFPAPLIDKASGTGFVNYVVELSPGEYHVYFGKS